MIWIKIPRYISIRQLKNLPKKTKRAEGTLIIRLLLVGDY